MEQGRAGFWRDIDPPSDKGQGALIMTYDENWKTESSNFFEEFKFSSV